MLDPITTTRRLAYGRPPRYCEECNKELLSNEGGWIITHTKKYFCHDGKDGSCFDNYCELKYKQQQQEKQNANGRKKEVQLYESW